MWRHYVVCIPLHTTSSEHAESGSSDQNHGMIYLVPHTFVFVGPFLSLKKKIKLKILS